MYRNCTIRPRLTSYVELNDKRVKRIFARSTYHGNRQKKRKNEKSESAIKGELQRIKWHVSRDSFTILFSFFCFGMSESSVTPSEGLTMKGWRQNTELRWNESPLYSRYDDWSARGLKNVTRELTTTDNLLWRLLPPHWHKRQVIPMNIFQPSPPLVSGSIRAQYSHPELSALPLLNILLRSNIESRFIFWHHKTNE